MQVTPPPRLRSIAIAGAGLAILVVSAALAPAQARLTYRPQDLDLPEAATSCEILDLDGDGCDDLFVVLGRRYVIIPGRAGAKLGDAPPPRAFPDDAVCFDLAGRSGEALSVLRRIDAPIQIDFHRATRPLDAPPPASGIVLGAPVFRAPLLHRMAAGSGPVLLVPGDVTDRVTGIVRTDAGVRSLDAPLLSVPHEHRLHISGGDLLDRISADTAPPGLAFGDANGDGRPDAIAIRPDRLDVFLHREDGSFPSQPGARIARPPRSPGTRLFRSALPPILRDLTGNGRLAFLDIDANAGLIRFHAGPLIGEGAALPRPIRFDGILLDVTPVDADADGRLDLCALVAETVTLVRGARMFVTQSMAVRVLTFRQRPGGRFPTRADARRDFSLPVDADLSVRPPRARPLPVWCYDRDLDGDGRPDLVARHSRGRLGIHPADEHGAFASRPAVELDLGRRPGARPAALAVGDLNGDGRPDLAAVMTADRSGRGWIRLFLSVPR